jgi:hypothetical protein
MATITYERDGDEIRVRVAGTVTGRIKPVRNGNRIKGYRYHPHGSSLKGKIYPTIEAVKHSLEGGRG